MRVRVLLLAAALTVAGGVLAPRASARPYVPSGQPITGGSDPGAAVALRPGTYVDTLARGSSGVGQDGSARYYAISLAAGETPYVAATLAAPSGRTADSVALRVSITPRADDEECAGDSDTAYGFQDVLPPVTVAAAGPPSRCGSGTQIVRVLRSGDGAVSTPLRFELTYRLEPRVRSTAGLPAAASEAPRVRTDLTGHPTGVSAGSGFATAPVLGSGIYRDSLAPHDTRIVRVHLAWGQRFAYSVSASGGPFENAPTVKAVVRNPVLREVGQSTGSASSDYGFGDDDSTLDGSTAAPVRYLNRRSGDDGVNGYALAGDYFLVLSADPSGLAASSARYPFTLQVQVFGTAQPGPRYAAPSGAAASDAPAIGSGHGGPGTVRTSVALAVGGVTLVLVVALLATAVRRRRRQRASHT